MRASFEMFGVRFQLEHFFNQFSDVEHVVLPIVWQVDCENFNGTPLNRLAVNA